MPNEETALVLDYMPKGKPNSYKPEPIAQVLGTRFFTLLEVTPKEGKDLKIMESVYVGKEERDKIEYIKRRVGFSELTSNAVSEIEKAIEKIVLDDKQRFIEFFNASGPVTIKMHQLELMPGLGKKHMKDILAERQKKQFESFEDLEKRVHLMPNPVKTIVKRVMEELEDETQKHYLFCRPPAKKDFSQRRREYR